MNSNTVCIDWLSYTAHQLDGKMGFLVPPYEDFAGAQADTPRYGYRKALRFPDGLVVMWDAKSATMGAHYVYSGATLANISEVMNVTGEGVIKWHEAKSHKCTRIDLAIDVPDGKRLIADVARLSEKREFTGTAHKANTIRSSDQRGLTIYVGSRISERFVRVYNKSAQLKIEGDWTRIECEVKGDSARAVSRAIIEPNNGGLGVVAQSVICRVCDFAVASWSAVFTGAKIPIGTPKSQGSDTEKWIIEVVAQAVARFERENPDKKILDRLWDAIETNLQGGTRE